ncbi:hypothetical protein FQA39_LY00391 [Lamprigera yunnana]|nr:hypothetical protein FQA39_LY00391 [Lamprigera yunnana]
MSKKQATSESGGDNALLYIAGAAVGAVAAAGIGYCLGSASTESTQQTRRERAHCNNTPSSSNNSTYTDNEPDCAICMKNYKPTRTLPCNHKFHEHCIDSWLAVRRVCPKCNRKV